MSVLVLLVPLVMLAALAFIYAEKNGGYVTSKSIKDEDDKWDEFYEMLEQCRRGFDDDDDRGGDLVSV